MSNRLEILDHLSSTQVLDIWNEILPDENLQPDHTGDKTKNFHCPKPGHKDKNASALINLRHNPSAEKGSFHCFGECPHEAIFDAYANNKGCSIPEALKNIANIAGIEHIPISPKTQKKLKTKPSKTSQIDFEKKWKIACNTKLKTDKYQDYLIDERNLQPEFVQQLFENKSILPARFNPTISQKKELTEQPVILFPYRLLTGKIVGIQEVSITGKPITVSGTNKRFQPGSKPSQGSFIAGAPIAKAESIILTEAPINSLTCSMLIPGSCSIAIGGTTFTKKLTELKLKINSDQKIYAAFDKDTAGSKAARTAANAFGRNIYTIDWPDHYPAGTDVNDLLQNEEVGAFFELFDNAKILAPSQSFHNTDYGNAERLKHTFGASLHYLPELGRWMIWNGKFWQIDKTNKIFTYAKKTVRNIYNEAHESWDPEMRRQISKHAQSSEAEQRINALIRLAQSEPEIPQLSDDLDQDPWLFNVLNGTINLKTGELQKHKKSDLITKISRVNFDPKAQGPPFQTFLNTIFSEKEELISFVQKAIGYALTGDISAQALFFLYGLGANGKSTLINLIMKLMGDYGQQSDFSSFIQTPTDRIRNDLARMRGSRFISAIEAGAGKQLDEVLVKQISGGDSISVRFLHQEFFEFTPTFKIFLTANHRPIIRGTDYAIWRRIKMIPFNVTIPEKDQDQNLPAKLLEELPGILNWAIEGCIKYQDDGLDPPEAVKDATADYKMDMDILYDFLQEMCLIQPTVSINQPDLYKAYTSWSHEKQEPAIGKKAFNSIILERGYISTKSHGRRIWRGIALSAKKHDSNT